MSSIAVTASATGTGTVSLVAPVTNTNRTLTLPDSTGTVLNDQSDILTQTKAALNASNGAPIYACRAWVNFNGTGTVAIRGSGNVSSITDNGVGDYTVNFTTAMPDANYAVIPNGTDAGFGSILATQSSNLTTSVRLYQRQSTGVAIDLTSMYVAIFR